MRFQFSTGERRGRGNLRPFSPLSTGTPGERGRGVRGTNKQLPRLKPLTPIPSPLEYKGRGASGFARTREFTQKCAVDLAKPQAARLVPNRSGDAGVAGAIGPHLDAGAVDLDGADG